ncbi:MAG: hypothetical protein ABW124_21710, partial [Candidatus Thiodiazotropha sp. 6PLUC9]
AMKKRAITLSSCTVYSSINNVQTVVSAQIQRCAVAFVSTNIDHQTDGSPATDTTQSFSV